MTHQFDRSESSLTSSIPFDLVLLAVYVAVADLDAFVGPQLLDLRAVLVIPLLSFIPGYVLLSILFPRRRTGSVESRSLLANRSAAGSGLSFVHRVALSIAASIAMLPVFALVGSLFSPGFDTSTTVGVLTAFVAFGVVLGAYRRWNIAPEERFAVAPRTRLAAAYRALTPTRSASDRWLTVVLVVGALLAVSTLGYGLATPTNAYTYSTFSVLTRDDSGTLVANGYPSTLDPGERTTLDLRVTNHENAARSYTVVVLVQRTSADGTTVESQRTAQEYTFDLDSGDTWTRSSDVALSKPNARYRVRYLLYRGDAPADPTVSSAYRHLHLWISTTGATGA